MDNVIIIGVEPLPGYCLRLELSDGRIIKRDLSDLVPPPGVENVFTPWREPGYFEQVRLDDWRTVVWPNGVDLCPDTLIEG